MLRRLMLATALVEVALGCCPKSAESIICGGKGDCHTADCVCKCLKGFIGGDCSQRSCPLGYAWTDHAVAVDNAHHLTECANMGVCDRTTGMCTCNMGFEGLSCSRKSCPAGCSGHGTGVPTADATACECECTAEFFGAACETAFAAVDCGHGTVVATCPEDDASWGCAYFAPGGSYDGHCDYYGATPHCPAACGPVCVPGSCDCEAGVVGAACGTCTNPY